MSEQHIARPSKERVPQITEPRRMTLAEAIVWAMEGQTRFIDAQVKICIWESERLVEWARAHASGSFETFFYRSLWDLEEAWNKSHAPETCDSLAIKRLRMIAKESESTAVSEPA